MIKENTVIPAIRNAEDLVYTINAKSEEVFLLKSNILILKRTVEAAKQAGKKLFIHFDMADGLGKDDYGIEYIRRIGAYGIISTKASIIKAARNQGLVTVQRFFILDSRSVQTALENINMYNPHLIELMPGIAPGIIRRFCGKVDAQIIAGGLIETRDEIEEAFSAGASAVSTGKKELWV